MLNMAYKIIANLISKWLRLLPNLVNHRQTGFVLGRQILEKNPAISLAMDWVPLHNLESLFLQLNFKKAFDMVNL